MEKPPKGIRAEILRGKGRSAFSLLRLRDHVTIVGDGIPEIFEADPDAPPVRLVKRTIQGQEYLHLEPVNRPREGWLAFGGSFAWSSDSRFPNAYPLAIHDRWEG